MKLIKVIIVLFFFVIIQQSNLLGQKINVDQRGLSIMVYHPNNITAEEKQTLKIHLNKNWTYGCLTLYTGEKIESNLVNYELRNGIFSIRNNANDSIKLVQGHLVKEYRVKTAHNKEKKFLNGKEFDRNSYPSIFGEVLTDGKYRLLKIPEVIRIRANYNVITNSGSKEDKLMLKYKLYCDNGSDLIQIKNSRKKIMRLFNDKSSDIKDYIRLNKLSMKKETDLIKIFSHYNNLIYSDL